MNYVSHGANLWLKNEANFDLSEESKIVINDFIEKYKLDSSTEKIKSEIINNIHDQKQFERSVLKLLGKLKLVKESEEDQEDSDFENSPGSTDDIENQDFESNSDIDELYNSRTFKFRTSGILLF